MGASAWAQTTVVNIPFTGTSSTIENGATYNGTVGSMTFSQPSGNSFKITNDYMIVGTGTGTVTIAEADRAGYAHKAEGKNNDIVEISFSMAFGNTAANTYAGFEVLDEDDNVIVTLMSSKWSGINSSANTFGLEAADITTQTGNTTLWSQKTDFTIEFNYLIGKITCKTNNNSTGKSINMAAGKPVVAKYVLKSDNSRGDDTRQPFFSNLIIRNTEGDYTTATANYTINWVCSGSTVKTDVRNGAIDAAIDLTSADKAAFWVNTTKYYYVSDNSGSKTIAEDGSTVVEITVREANTWTATIKAIDSESNEIGDVKTATGIEGESVTVAHPKAAYLGGTWYECTSVNDYRHTLTEGSSSVDVTYDASSRIAYYFDNEDYTVVYQRDGGYLPERGASSYDAVRLSPNGYLYTPELKAGVYNLIVNKNNSNSSEASLSIEIRNGEDVTSTELNVTQAQNAYYTESTTENIVIPSDGCRLQLTNNTSWNSYMSVDYMILTFVRPVNVSPSVTDYATFSSPYALDFTSATGVKAYYASASDGSTVTMTKVTGAVAAGTGLLLQKTDGEISIPTAATGTDLSATNLLKVGTGAAVKTEGTTHRYVLAGEGDATSFYELAASADAVVIPEGKAYLEVANAGARLKISFSDGETTGIANVEKTSAVAEGIYNLNGQRVAAPQKGLYIVNGKKVIKK